LAFGSNALAEFPVPAIEWGPERYPCGRTVDAIVVDGRLDEATWASAPWTAAFVDIRGRDFEPKPRFRTRAKMSWDDVYFYVAADMEEPHLWSTLTERDAVIYHDNDFEVFIDPNGDTHEYYELEVNLLGTEWDLFLTRPYRDAGSAVDAWDITGLQTAVHLRGTLNDPSDIDDGWSIEIAMPWSVLEECAHRPTPPDPGDHWYVNFSRVQWPLDSAPGGASGGYVKRERDGRRLPEDNWVWSPQGLVNMHYPEMWGVVAFLDAPAGESAEIPTTEDERLRWTLRRIYYAQRARETATEEVAALDVEDPHIPGYAWPPSILLTAAGYEVTWRTANRAAHLREDGKVWFTEE
jgi:hypothetical protein